jgi:hypothetical protein
MQYYLVVIKATCIIQVCEHSLSHFYLQKYVHNTVINVLLKIVTSCKGSASRFRICTSDHTE